LFFIFVFIPEENWFVLNKQIIVILQMSDNLEEEQDFSWIVEQERLQNLQNNFIREPMERIPIKYIYINQNNYIDKILCETIPLEQGGLTHGEILRISESKKVKTANSRYKLKDILLFHVGLEPEHIQAYAKNDDFLAFSSGFMKVLSIVDKVSIPESVFIFHDINTLYFIFQEVEMELVGGSKQTIKSILKKGASGDVRKVNTKKVRITFGNNKPVNPKSRKTRRNLGS
jgi:hypothetical protein